MLSSTILDLFRAQYGLLSHRQAREVLDQAARRRLYRHPDVERWGDRVLRHQAVPVTLGTHNLGAVLNLGRQALLWDESAANWFGFGRCQQAEPQVATERVSVRRPIGEVRRLVAIHDVDRSVHLGVPIARPERVLLGIAAVETRRVCPSHLRRPDRHVVEILEPAIRKTEPVVDHAWRMRLIDGEFIHDMCDRLAGHGQAGIIVLRELLKKRPPDYVPPGSRLERRFEGGLGDRVSARLQRQVRVDDQAGFIGRVDYRARRVPLIIEINSETFHTTLTDRAADDVRYERLLAAGYSVCVVWEYDVWHQMPKIDGVLARLTAVRDDRPTLHRPTPAPWEMLPTRQPFDPEGQSE